MTPLAPEHQAIVEDAIWRLATDHKATKAQIISDSIARALEAQSEDIAQLESKVASLTEEKLFGPRPIEEIMQTNRDRPE